MGKSSRFTLSFVVLQAAGAVACGGGTPPAKSQEMVPANSAYEPEKKDDGSSPDGNGANGGNAGGGAGGASGGKGSGAGATSTTGTGTMPQKIGGDAPAPGATTPTPAPTGAGSATATAAPAPGGPKVTKAECKKALDRYVDLAIAADPNLAGLPPDVIKQAFAQAASQSGDPCAGDGVSRNQYKCAMKATTTDAWQTCMK